MTIDNIQGFKKEGTVLISLNNVKNRKNSTHWKYRPSYENVVKNRV